MNKCSGPGDGGGSWRASPRSRLGTAALPTGAEEAGSIGSVGEAGIRAL